MAEETTNPPPPATAATAAPNTETTNNSREREYANVTLKGESTPGTLFFNDKKLAYRPGSEEGSKLKVKWTRVVDYKTKKRVSENDVKRLKIQLDDEQALVLEFVSQQDFEDAKAF